MATNWDEGSVEYFEITPTQVLKLGERYPLSSPGGWYTPPRVMGSRSMTKGDSFYSFYQKDGTGVYYMEYVFVGLEDVTVPAGVFPNCLKFIMRTYDRVGVYYYAKNVGLVKWIQDYLRNQSRPSEFEGRFRELSLARIGGTIYPAASSFCLGNGTWTRTIGGAAAGSGTFSFPFDPQSSPIHATLRLVGYYTFALVSQDGVNFAPDPAYYPDPQSLPDVSITVQGGTISGTYNDTWSLGPSYEDGVEVHVTLTGSCQ